LHAHLKDAGAGLDLSGQFQESVGLHDGPPPPRQDGQAAAQGEAEPVSKLHTGILETLSSVEQPLGKAYLLGYEMKQMCATRAVNEKSQLRRQSSNFPASCIRC
jgi:hypothetical protein